MKTCAATSVAAKVTVPGVEGQLLFFEHKGIHSCTPMSKKGKAVLSPATQEAIRKAVPAFGKLSAEKLKHAATMSSFEKMLTEDDSTMEDVFKVAFEVQDTRGVRAAVQSEKRDSGTHSISKNMELERDELQRILSKKNFRLFPFDHRPLKFFMSPLDLPWSPAKIALLMDRVLGKPPFNTAKCYSDGGHSCVKGFAVEQVSLY